MTIKREIEKQRMMTARKLVSVRKDAKDISISSDVKRALVSSQTKLALELEELNIRLLDIQ